MTETVSAPARYLLVAAAFVIVVAGMRAAAPILVPFLLSVFIATISAPPMFWLQRRGLPGWLSMLSVISAVGLLGLGFAGVIGSSIDGFSAALPGYEARLREMTTELFGWLSAHGIAVDDQLRKHIDPGAIMGLAGHLLNGLGNMLANAFLIFLTVIFILAEAAGFSAKLRLAVADPQASMARFQAVMNTVNHYLAIKTWASLATGVVVGVWLWLVGVDFPVLWALLAFLLNYVPNIGSIIAAVPAVLLAAVQLGPAAAGWSALGFVVANNLIGSVLEPRFMGKRLGLSALVVFLSLIFWGWLLGPVGMFLSVPLTMTVKIAMEANDNTRWLAVLLGNDAETT